MWSDAIVESSFYIENCHFIGNVAQESGGAVYVSDNGGPAGFRNCTFTGNVAGRGGAVFNVNATLRYEHCLFENNRAQQSGGSGQGGAAQIGWSQNVLFKNCEFRENEALGTFVGYGGAIYDAGYNDLLIIENGLFVSNNAQNNGGNAVDIGFELSNVEIVNTTFYDHPASSQIGGTVHMVDFNWLKLVNSIVWSPTWMAGDPAPVGYMGSYLVEYNNIQGGIDVVGGYGGVGNIDSDPMFYDDLGGDFHLTCGSPCIDAGDGGEAPTTDFDGAGRVDDTGSPNVGVGPPWVEMGCYEYVSVNPS